MFSGVGGFELGIEQATKDNEDRETTKSMGWIQQEDDGRTISQNTEEQRRMSHKWECIGFSEIDKYSISTYKKHFPTHKNFGDARNINPKELPDFDMLCGGFPCQSFSIAGKRKGFQDTRGTLFYEICRVVAEKRPRLLFLENVKGLLSADDGRCFATILTSLDELGYDVEWQVINSKYFVPQSRDRTFIIGHIRGKCSRKIFPLGEIRGVSKETHQTKYLPSLTVSDSKGSSKQRAGNMIVKLGNVVDSPGNSLGVRCYDPKGIAPSLVANGGGLGGKSGLYALSHTKGNMKQRYQERDNTWSLDTSGNKMAVGEGMRIRRLTPVECERLQGFPDDWTKGVSDTQRYKLMGNAVTVDVVEYIAREL